MSENNDLYFGGCPECRDMTMLNIERNHYGLCHEHKVKWYIGANLFSAWRHETEEQWIANAAILEGYKEIEPLLPPRETTGEPA